MGILLESVWAAEGSFNNHRNFEAIMYTFTYLEVLGRNMLQRDTLFFINSKPGLVRFHSVIPYRHNQKQLIHCCRS